MDRKLAKINRIIRIVRKTDSKLLETNTANRVKVMEYHNSIKQLQQFFKLSMNLLVSPLLDNLKSNVRHDIKNAVRLYREQSEYVKYNSQVVYIEVVDRSLGREPLLIGPYNSNSKLNRLAVKDAILQAIQDRRLKLKTVQSKTKDIKGFRLQTKGGVFTASNSILAVMKQLKRRKVTTDKIPLSKDKHVGIEIECFINGNDDLLTDALLEANLQDKVCIKDDGSLEHDDSDLSSVELTLCDTEANYKQTVKRLCTVLQDFDAVINKTCGLHVHLDMRKRDAYASAKRLIQSQPFLFKLVPHSRRKNNFCLPTHPNQDLDTTGERYKAINLSAYNKHSTIEIRLHGGTVESDKIINWTELLIKIADTESIRTSNPTTLPQWIKALGLNADLSAYIKARAIKFQLDTEKGKRVKINYEEFFKAAKFDPGEVDEEYEEVSCDHCDYTDHHDNMYRDSHGRDWECPSCYDESEQQEDAEADERRRNRG